MTKKIDNIEKDITLSQKQEKVKLEKSPQDFGKKIEITEQKIQEMKEHYESVTGHKVDLNDLDWNKFLYGFSVAQRKTKKVVLYSVGIMGILGWGISIIDPSFSFRSIIYTYFFESILLFLVSMDCFITFIAGHLPIYDSISIPDMLHKIIEKTSPSQKFVFLVRWILIMIILSFVKVCVELTANLSLI